MHTAANAGAYQTAVFGFGGFAVDDGVVRLTPALPRHWSTLEFSAIVHGRRIMVSVTRSATTVSAAPDNDAPVAVSIDDGEVRLVAPGTFVTA
jgi:trehalose/maltose hydrolase-like predicted phosphorylase